MECVLWYARFEYQRLAGKNLAVYNAEGNPVGRFAGYHIGAVAADGTKIRSPSFQLRLVEHGFHGGRYL